MRGVAISPDLSSSQVSNRGLIRFFKKYNLTSDPPAIRKHITFGESDHLMKPDTCSGQWYDNMITVSGVIAQTCGKEEQMAETLPSTEGVEEGNG